MLRLFSDGCATIGEKEGFPPSKTSQLTGFVMDLLMWLVVGLIAGVLASLVVGGSGYGLIGDIVVGMVGALIGGWLFDALAVSTPFEGIAGSIFVAFIGAVLLLVVLHLIRRRTYVRRTHVHHGPVVRRPLWSRWRR